MRFNGILILFLYIANVKYCLSFTYVPKLAVGLRQRGIRGLDVSLVSGVSQDSHNCYKTLIKCTPLESDDEERFTFKDFVGLLTDRMVERKWWGLYNRAISSKGLQSLLTKSCSSFVGFLVGDFLSQILTSRDKFNIVRFLRMGTFGALVHAPAGHIFYRNLERRIPGSSRNAIVKKVVIDQLFWTPLFAVFMFSYNGVLAGNAFTKVLKAMKTSKSVLTYMITSLLLWPTAHYINYNAIPPNKRLLYINSVQIFFNTIIAGLAASFCANLALV